MIDPKVADKVVKLVKGGAQYQYFFDSLSTAEWIRPLKERDFFSDPPAPVEEDGYIWFPIWPESRYLARVAKDDPSLVLETLLGIPPTNNVRVQEDMIDAALQMPAEMSARIAQRATEWLKRPYLLLPTKAGSLVAHMASGGRRDEALAIARGLLEVVPGRHWQGYEEPPPRWTPDPTSRIDSWEYEQFLKTHLPILLTAFPDETLTLLSDSLQTALALGRDRDAPDLADYSELWRPSIGAHPQNSGYGGIRDTLISSVTDAAEYVITKDPSKLAQVVADLENRGWTAFRRISLHLLSKHRQGAQGLVAARLADRNLLEASSLWHEYSELAQSQFGELPIEAQEEILGWIEVGPDLSRYMSRVEADRGSRPSSEEMTAAKEHWQLRRLAVLKDQLPEKWKWRYQRLVGVHGEPEHPDLLMWSSGVVVGPTSPLTADQLSAMPIEEIVAFAREWKPQEGFALPTPEGLSRALSTAASNNPTGFSKSSDAFRSLDPTHVRGIIMGLREAVGRGSPLEWEPLLDLSLWAVEQQDSPKGVDITTYRNEDQGWGWTRTEIARLIEEGLKPGNAAIPFRLRRQVWKILEPILRDPDPEPSKAIDSESSSFDAVTTSINSTRGCGLHAVFRYALWCHRNIGSEETKGLPSFMESRVPEVAEVLDEHLDPETDPSTAVRSVYGFWLGSLRHIDRDWLLSQRRRIFPVESGLVTLREAAWEGFVLFNQPYRGLIEDLQEEYAWALHHVGDNVDERGWAGNPSNKLAEHLLAYYWMGLLDIGSDLFREFWTVAPVSIRAHAISFVGRGLAETTEEVPAAASDRLMRLWEARLDDARGLTDPRARTEELREFGWWFASGKLETEWSLEQLRSVLAITGEVQAGHLVVSRLAEVDDGFLAAAVSVLGMLVEGDTKGWAILSWRDDAKTLLQRALTNEDARQSAVDLIHRIGSRGHLEFRDLIEGV